MSILLIVTPFQWALQLVAALLFTPETLQQEPLPLETTNNQSRIMVCFRLLSVNKGFDIHS